MIVFVIGESFNKHHSSLYGYYLPTSKQLEIERDKGRLFVFNNAWTPTSSTNYAMRYIFTMKGCNEKENDSSGYVVLYPQIAFDLEYNLEDNLLYMKKG